MPLPFTKMHGAGNDFVIVDRRRVSAPLTPERVALIADRHRGVGFDQLITIEAARTAGAVAAYSILNADGSRAGQCGNGARCVAAWLVREGAAGAEAFVLDGPSGAIVAQRRGEDFAIDMGVPDFSPQAIALDRPQMDPYIFPIGDQVLRFGAVSMGNPHAVMEVPDVATAAVETLGPVLQREAGFKDSCNVGFAQIIDPHRVALRVYERGVGETLACGSGACAAVAVLARRGRLASRVAVQLPGGTLTIDWPGTGHPIQMAGPAAFVFEGEFLA